MIRLDPGDAAGRRIDDKIIPMINVIFLLLMFFLIVGNISKLVNEEVVPPRSSTNTVTTAADTDWVLARDGRLFVAGEAVSLAEFAARLEHPAAPLPRTVVLRADAAARSGALLPLMDLLRDHGVARISLVTINDDGGR